MGQPYHKNNSSSSSSSTHPHKNNDRKDKSKQKKDEKKTRGTYPIKKDQKSISLPLYNASADYQQKIPCDMQIDYLLKTQLHIECIIL